MRKIRVLLVEDSVTIRQRLRAVLAGDPDLDIAAEATDGERAVELCDQVRPDVVTMDMMLPVMSGLAATEEIMANCPTPILVVSSSTNRGEIFQTYDALAAGAVDVLDKPTGDEPDGAWERRLIAAVKMASRIRVITHPRARLRPARWPTARSNGQSPECAMAARDPNRSFDALCLGASTGGPGALLRLLRDLPSTYTIPVLIVLHIGEPFALAFTDWLTRESGRQVSYARDGEKLTALAGQAVLAPPGQHLTVHNGRLSLDGAPERHSCRPSVDVLFESVARELGPTAAGCLLTGMGRDGARGLLELRSAGGLTIAQDEASSTVYGMPREAALLNAAELILPLDQMGSVLVRLTARQRTASS
jgi:two-component system chemotaxis response regulator CheB